MQLDTGFIGVVVVLVLILAICLVIVLGGGEGNQCRICGRTLRARRTQLNRLCHVHEEEFAKYAAGVIPYKYWQQISKDGKVDSAEYYRVLEELKKQGHEPVVYTKDERQPKIQFDVE